ncbi:MAG: hypothetical protein ACREKH_09565, partial [Candidatus Rokuibacteriota bacterium]
MLRAFLLIVVGLAGDPEHGEHFAKWGSALADASAKVGVARERLVYLADAKGEAGKASGRATREEIEKALAGFAGTATAEDVVYVVLFGHGSHDGRTARFNLPGPDMTPADFNALLRKVPGRVVFVNTSSSSGPFVEELSGTGRTIITATRSGAEQFTTLFGGYFVEAFRFAKAGVARAYEQEGLLSTEHAMLDDNGDKQGSQDPMPTGA